MANDIVGTVGFSCTGNDGVAQSTISKDITVRADWRARPDDVRELFRQEAGRLSQITGFAAENGCRSIAFNGQISNYLVTRTGVFTCDQGNGKKTTLTHEVYTLRVKNELPLETDRRLALEAVERHKGIIIRERGCAGTVEFTGALHNAKQFPSATEMSAPEAENTWKWLTKMAIGPIGMGVLQLLHEGMKMHIEQRTAEVQRRIDDRDARQWHEYVPQY